MKQVLEERVMAFLGAPGYEPLKRHELATSLGLEQEERSELRRALRALEDDARIVRLRKNRFAPASPHAVREGALRVHRDGYGILTTTDNQEEYVVPEEKLHGLIPGDVVRFEALEASPPRHIRGWRSARLARVIAVVSREHRRVVGLLMKAAGYAYVIPDHDDLPENIRVRDYAPGIEDVGSRHKVLVELDPPGKERGQLAGVVLEDLGHEEDPGVDILSIVRRKNIPAAHSAAVTQAVREIVPLRESATDERRNLRERLIFTIDPDDAKDFDDAVSLEQLDDGRVRLGVHIADVAHYVEPGSAIDAESLVRGNSVYLVDRVIPMLPAYLTTEICSLVPDEDRFTHTIDMILTPEGAVESFATYPSLIHSAARLNYNQVQYLLDNRRNDEIAPPIRPVLLAMHKLARTLRAKRTAEGSVTLNMPEVSCRLDARGVPTRIVKRVEFEAYQLVEEFMLLANRVVARFLLEREAPCLFRVHPAPDQEQWKRMAAELHVLGIPQSPSNRTEINRLAESLRGNPVEYAASTLILRNFKQAVYSAACDPHFGLAFEHYTHFTSPIRRYPDLVVHRVLKAVETGRPLPYSGEELSEIARQCSATERAAMEAERESLSLKRVEYFANLFRSNKRGPFKGMVAAVLPIGLIVELTDSMQGGLIHFSSLGDDRYVVNPTHTRAVGRRYKETYAVGMMLDVEIVRVDERKNRIDFRLAKSGGEGQARRPKKTSGKRHRRNTFNEEE